MAVVEVGNGMIERKWRYHNDVGDTIDMDTLPDKRNVRDKLNQIGAETLSFVVDAVKEGAEGGRMITAAIYSTTNKRAGPFATQGIHIGQNVPFPLPLMNICVETTEDIAMQVDFGFEILAAVKKKPVEDIYKLVDTHMTDSTSHNKGFADILADLCTTLNILLGSSSVGPTPHLVQVHGRDGAGVQAWLTIWTSIGHDIETCCT